MGFYHRKILQGFATQSNSCACYKAGEGNNFSTNSGYCFFANKGDRLIKTPYSKYAYLVTQYGDSSRYRIFSKTCDSELGDQFK